MGLMASGPGQCRYIGILQRLQVGGYVQVAVELGHAIEKLVGQRRIGFTFFTQSRAYRQLGQTAGDRRR